MRDIFIVCSTTLQVPLAIGCLGVFIQVQVNFLDFEEDEDQGAQDEGVASIEDDDGIEGCGGIEDTLPYCISCYCWYTICMLGSVWRMHTWRRRKMCVMHWLR